MFEHGYCSRREMRHRNALSHHYTQVLDRELIEFFPPQPVTRDDKVGVVSRLSPIVIFKFLKSGHC